jgi:hypothetical protein
MKLGKLLPIKFLKKAGQKGQAIVEFALILVVMAFITYQFVFLMNKNLARYWEHAANLVVNDKAGVKTLTLK